MTPSGRALPWPAAIMQRVLCVVMVARTEVDVWVRGTAGWISVLGSGSRESTPGTTGVSAPPPAVRCAYSLRTKTSTIRRLSDRYLRVTLESTGDT